MRRRPRDLPGPMHTVLAPRTKQMISNLTVATDGSVMAGYRISPVRWEFTARAVQEQLLNNVADTYAVLAGRDYQQRVCLRPHAVATWAKALSDRTPHPAPDIDGETFNDYLARQQIRIGQGGMDDKITFRFFSVGTVEPRTDLRTALLALAVEGVTPPQDVRTVLAEEKRVFDAVHGAPGWMGERMSDREMGWVRQRSLAPGMPAPHTESSGGWDEQDLPALANDVRWSETPFDRTVKVVAWRDGRKVERHVQILTATRTSDLRYPENGLEPWQTYAERAGLNVEWNIVGRLAEGTELGKRATLDLNKAMSIHESYQLFGEVPPEYTERGIQVAREARDQITTGQPRDSVRFTGSFNIIVTGEDEEKCEENADRIKRLYAGTDLRMEFSAPQGQSRRLRDTIPGEGWDSQGYQRQVRLSYLAAGMPNATAVVGDGKGPYVGFTMGASRRPVMHDSHYATEGRGVLGRKQNMWAIVATLGGGKSVLLDSLAYNNVRRGAKVIARDPSGPMMALCEIPELKAVSTAMNLLQGERGILSPPGLVRAPQQEEFPDWSSYDQALAEAEGERRNLVMDTARRCLHPDLYDDRATFAALRTAARTVRWTPQTSLWDLVYSLERMGEGGELALALRDAADMPLLSLMFPPEGQAGDFASALAGDSLLTVISTPGIRRAPDSVPRIDWSPKETAADAILRLTAIFTDRELFAKRRGERAVAIFDEAEDMTDSGAGRGYLARLGRDHSKWNIAAYLAFKNLTPEMLGGEMLNFLAGAWVGKMANRQPAEDLLDILHIDDKAYAQVLMNLSTRQPGQFVHLDADGRVGGVQIDVEHHPQLRAAALTNPTPAGSAGWTEGELS